LFGDNPAHGHGLFDTSVFLQGLKMEAVCFSETLISTYKSTWRYSKEDQEPYFQRSLEKRKSRTV
jgi:hypothetical protein